NVGEPRADGGQPIDGGRAQARRRRPRGAAGRAATAFMFCATIRSSMTAPVPRSRAPTFCIVSISAITPPDVSERFQDMAERATSNFLRENNTRQVRRLMAHPNEMDSPQPRIAVSGEGSTVTNIDGKCVVDAVAGLWNVNRGYSN